MKLPGIFLTLLISINLIINVLEWLFGGLVLISFALLQINVPVFIVPVFILSLIIYISKVLFKKRLMYLLPLYIK